MPPAWLSKLSPEQKQAVFQKGLDGLSVAEIRALKGISRFQENGNDGQTEKEIKNRNFQTLKDCRYSIVGRCLSLNLKNQKLEILTTINIKPPMKKSIHQTIQNLKRANPPP